MLILAFVVIALVAGFIADYLVGRQRKYERWELFVVGIVGSFVGGMIFSWLDGGDFFTIRITGLIGSIIGAIVVLVDLRTGPRPAAQAQLTSDRTGERPGRRQRGPAIPAGRATLEPR